MKCMVQVSVVIPVYNAAPYLRRCIGSVLEQTLQNIEIICVDDGSTDESPHILGEYASTDVRFRVVTQKNAGPGAARNAGMAAAGGKYLIFLDSDDWFEETFLEKMALRAEETGAEAVICKAVEFDTVTGKDLPSEWMMKTEYLPDLVFSPESIADHLFQFTYGMPWDKMFLREWLAATGLKFPPLKNSEDLAFVYPALLEAGRIAVLPDAMIHHRVNRSSSVSNSRASQPDAPYEAFQIVKQYLESSGKMALYHRSFLNWAMEFLVWHVSNMDDPAIQREYFAVLREKWFPELRFDQYGSSFYENRSNYWKYLLAKKAPYAFFAGTVKLYKWGKRLLKG